MPPKRRRLAGWAVFGFILLGGLLGSAVEAVGVPQPWRPLLVAAVLAAVFIPLIRSAVLETRQLRAEGIDLPSYPATGNPVTANAIITAILWVLFAVTVAIGQPVFPLLQIAVTIWLAYLIGRWRAGSH
jgi:hypothetical protein